MKRNNVVQFVSKSACFLRKQSLQVWNSFILNFKHQTFVWWYFDGIFPNKAGKAFNLVENFLKRESPTLNRE